MGTFYFYNNAFTYNFWGIKQLEQNIMEDPDYSKLHILQSCGLFILILYSREQTNKQTYQPEMRHTKQWQPETFEFCLRFFSVICKVRFPCFMVYVLTWLIVVFSVMFLIIQLDGNVGMSGANKVIQTYRITISKVELQLWKWMTNHLNNLMFCIILRARVHSDFI